MAGLAKDPRPVEETVWVAVHDDTFVTEFRSALAELQSHLSRFKVTDVTSLTYAKRAVDAGPWATMDRNLSGYALFRAICSKVNDIVSAREAERARVIAARAEAAQKVADERAKVAWEAAVKREEAERHAAFLASLVERVMKDPDRARAELTPWVLGELKQKYPKVREVLTGRAPPLGAPRAHEMDRVAEVNHE